LKADLCAKALAEARRIARAGELGPSLHQLLARARELLDDIEEILLALNLTGSGLGNSIAVALRREIDSIHADMPNARTASHNP
jgi:hypothetical protein